MTSTTLAPLVCPKCNGEMRTYERSTVHVDQCRDCRGIFLDRGELERLVDLEAAAMERPAPAWVRTGDPGSAPGSADAHSAARGSDARSDPPTSIETGTPGHPQRRRGGLLRDLLEGFGD